MVNEPNKAPRAPKAPKAPQPLKKPRVITAPFPAPRAGRSG
jgi:hypothetical protein